MNSLPLFFILILLQSCSSTKTTASFQSKGRAPASEREIVTPSEVQDELKHSSNVAKGDIAEDVVTPSEDDIATLKSINIKRSEEIASKKLRDYSHGPKAAGNLTRDLNDFKIEAQKLGVFPTSVEFEHFWNANLKKFTREDFTLLMPEIHINQLALTIFAAVESDIASSIDAKDPKSAELKEQNMPTKGDEHFVKALESSESKRSLIHVTSVAVGVALAAIAAKVKDIFFFGTGSQLTNTVAEPFIRPIRERLDQIVNTHLAPRLVPWARFVTGEAGRQRRALKAAKEKNSGVPETAKAKVGGVDRYQHVSLSVEDFVEDHKNFYGEMMAADAKWKGWLSAEFQRARNTGWELIYSQPRWLNEQLNNFTTSINIARLVQIQELVPLLMKEGAEVLEIEKLSKLIKTQQDIMVFEDVRSSKLPELEKEIMKIVDHWISVKKIKSQSIRAFYDGQIQLILAENRPAFALAAFLDSERYYQEYNLALADLPKLQMWQEQSREMTGIYSELRKHREKIEKFFLKRGIKYDVMARVNERGFPFGGKNRPHDVSPVTDKVLDRLDSMDGIRVGVASEKSLVPKSCATSLQMFLHLKR